MNYLEHHGIKGMRWGVRKNTDNPVTAAERMAYAHEEQVNNTNKLNSDVSLHEINTRKKIAKDNNSTDKKIHKAWARTVITIAAIAAGTKIAGMIIHGKANSNSGTSELPAVVSHSSIYIGDNDDESYLCHFGRKGMRWGRHIFDDPEMNEKITSKERAYYYGQQTKYKIAKLEAKNRWHETNEKLEENRNNNRTSLAKTKNITSTIKNIARMASYTVLGGMNIAKSKAVRLAKINTKPELSKVNAGNKLDLIKENNRHLETLDKSEKDYRVNHLAETHRSKEAQAKVAKDVSPDRAKSFATVMNAQRTARREKTNKKTNTMVGVVNVIKSNNKSKRVKHSDLLLDSSVIFASGIKGMKWGVRRYQNADGTLTEAGKARYNQNGDELDARDMSSDDLDRATNRLNKERAYNYASGKEYRNPGQSRKAARTVLISAGATFAASSLASYVYNKYKKNDPLKGKELMKRAMANGLLSAGIAAITSYASINGASANRSTDLDNAIKSGKDQK